MERNLFNVWQKQQIEKREAKKTDKIRFFSYRHWAVALIVNYMSYKS